MNFLLGPGQFSGLMLNFQGVSLFFWFREAYHFLQLLAAVQLIMILQVYGGCLWCRITTRIAAVGGALFFGMLVLGVGHTFIKGI